MASSSLYPANVRIFHQWSFGMIVIFSLYFSNPVHTNHTKIEGMTGMWILSRARCYRGYLAIRGFQQIPSISKNKKSIGGTIKFARTKVKFNFKTKSYLQIWINRFRCAIPTNMHNTNYNTFICPSIYFCNWNFGNAEKKVWKKVKTRRTTAARKDMNAHGLLK